MERVTKANCDIRLRRRELEDSERFKGAIS